MPLARVITCSDAAARGEREDRSGPAVAMLLTQHGFVVDRIAVVPDDEEAIANEIRAAVDDDHCRVVVTTGGTGISARDVTPEATARVTTKPIPGFGELMRAASQQKTAMAALARTGAATRGDALVINVPGSVAGSVENLAVVLPLVPHALALLEGKTDHPPRPGTDGT